MRRKIRIFFIIFVVVFSAFAQKSYTIKMATIAPEGSSWMIQMQQFQNEIALLTNGQIRFKVYPNGVQGSEKDMLRKMRLGQLHAGTFTGVGLGEIVPEIRVLELPFLFRNSDEVDYVYNAMFDYFQERFIEEGFFIAAWAEVGFIYLFTKKPVRQFDDFSKIKMWLWKDDPLAREAFKVLNIPAVPLDITDVHTSLQTGLIDGVYISPYGLLALQWFTRINYMLHYPLTNSLGAVLITKQQMSSIPGDLQNIMIDKTREYMRKIVVQSRLDNIESINVLKEAGIRQTEINDPILLSQIEAAGREIQQNLINKLYSREVLEKVLSLLEQYRALNDS
jgi:TRAP-type C4-dicarboxylate transport system substrate-binding protein